MKTAAVDLETDDQRAEFSSTFHSIDEAARSSKAFKSLSETKGFANQGREALLMRAVHLAETRLKAIEESRNAKTNLRQMPPVWLRLTFALR